MKSEGINGRWAETLLGQDRQVDRLDQAGDQLISQTLGVSAP